MINYPNVLSNPFDPVYKLSDAEKYSLKECDELISLEKYSYSFFAFWNASIINIQRRIEFFGIDVFLNIIEKKEEFNINGNNLKDRWLNINEYKILFYGKKLNIINHITHDLLSTLFWMKSNTNEEENKEITKDEIIALVYLIEKNLFLKPYKEDLRGKNPAIKNTKLKFRRKEDMSTDTNAIPRTYHNILMKSGVKAFEDSNNLNKNKDKLLDKYC